MERDARTLAVPGPRTVSAAEEDAVSRESLQLRATLARMCRDLVEAIEDGGVGMSELLRLRAWLRAELLPWVDRHLRARDPRARSTLAGPLEEIKRLDAELLHASGAEAAHAACRLRRDGTDLVAALVELG